MAKYKNFSPAKKAFIKLIGLITIVGFMYGFIRYNIYRANECEQFINRQQKAQHIKIDEVDGYSVWLIIYQGDTVGTLATK